MENKHPRVFIIQESEEKKERFLHIPNKAFIHDDSSLGETVNYHLLPAASPLWPLLVQRQRLSASS